MLVGNAQDDGRMEDSQSSNSTKNGPSDMMANLKDEMWECFLSIEKRLGLHFEKRFADLTEQQGVLQANVEDVEKKQDVLQSTMEKIEEKIDKLLQVEKRVEEKLAANCTILEMMLCQARAGSSGSSQDNVPDHLSYQGATDESARATGWPGCARAFTPLPRWFGAQPLQEVSCGNNTRRSPQPGPSNTTAITTVTTVASTCKTEKGHQQSIPSSQMSYGVTTSTSTYLQPRTQPRSRHLRSPILLHWLMKRSQPNFSQSASQQMQMLVFQQVQQPFMPCAMSGESCGQVHPDILCDVLAAASRYHNQLSATSENNHTRVIVQHLQGNTMNYVVALVNDEGQQQLAVKRQSLGDQATPLSSVLDQTSVFPQLPQVPRRRRASCGGTVLTEVMILQLSRMIGHKWKSIGIECLQFSSDDLSRIDADHNDVETKIFEMIKGWNRRQGVEGGTVEKLADLLKKSCEIDCNVFVFMESLRESPESTD